MSDRIVTPKQMSAKGGNIFANLLKSPTSTVAPGMLPALMTCMFVAALATPVSAAVNVFNLPANPSQLQIADAKAALASGSVIQMTNVSPAAFTGNLHIALPKPKSGVDTQLCVIAAHRGRRGNLHTYSGPEVVSGRSASAACTTGVQTWATKDALVADADAPTAEAWTELTVQTFTATAKGGTLQETVGVYRVNSSNSQTDYYMITKQADINPDLETCKEAISCGYYSSSRNLSISTDIPTSTPGYAIFDHGPLQTNSSTTNSFSVGGQISGTGPSVSATFGQSWSQQDVTTKDTTNLASGVASWNDSFRSDFSYGSPPAAVVKLWESDQAVIYTVPVGTLSFNVQINDSATFSYDNGFETTGYGVGLGAFIQVSPPSLSVYPPILRGFPGQTITFDVNALIPDGTGETLGWTVSNIPTGVSLNTTTGSGPATIQFNIPASATRGLLGTLNINTTAVFASPEVRSGPLQYPITVISSSDVPPGVLVTGGIDWSPAQVAIFSAEVWNPATQTSTAVGQMNYARAYHTATPIANDQVLITGGLNDSLSLIGSTEIYSQSSESFSNGPAMQTPRYNHTATLLNNGTVLLTGGGDTNNNAIATAEIYDPVSNTTTLTGNMTAARVLHTATLLQNGTVLLVGGADKVFGGNILSSAEIYNPQTKTFTATGSMSVGLQNQAATLLSNGQVLIAGGDSSTGGFYNGAFLYTSSSGSFTNTPEGASLSHDLALVALPQSSALLINGGGTSIQGTSLWNPTTNTFGTGGILLEQRDRPKAALLRNTGTSLDGSVVIAGGVVLNSGTTGGESVEVVNTSVNQSSRAGTMTTPRSGNTITAFGGVPATTSVTLTSSQNPSITGNPVTITAVVAGTSGTPGGTVTFNDGATALGSPVTLSSGSAQYTANSLSVGQHSITAAYSGDSYNAPSTSSVLSQTVNPLAVASSFTSLRVSQATIAPLTPNVSVSGVISGPGPIYPATTETVVISIGSIAMTAQIGPNGSFIITNFPTSTLNAGSYGISFVYAGDTMLKSASDNTTLNLTVVASSSTTVTSSQNPSTAGQSVTFTATVASSAGTPTGSITFMDGSTALGSPVMLSSGTAQSPSLTTLSVGSHSITAAYSGMADISGSTSSALSQTVNAAAVAASFSGLTSAPSINVGASTVTLSGTISGPGPTYPAATEVVTVTINNTSAKANFINSTGGFTTNFPTTTFAAGSYQIVYSYAGDAKLMSKNDNSTSLTVNTPAPSSISVQSSSASGVYGTSLSGQSVRFSAGVPSTKNGIVATGTVTFLDGTTTLQTVPLSTASTTYGSAQYTTTSLAVGVHNITVTYSGDSTYSPSKSPAWQQTVNVPSTFTNLKSILVPVGTQSVVVSGVISGAGPTYPDGSADVIVQIGGAEGFKIPDGSGNFSITVNISSLTASSYPILVVFAGDSKLFNARDNSTTLTRQSSTTTTVLSSLNPSAYGQPVTFAATVASSNGTPTGSVFFSDGTTSLGPGVPLNGGKASLSISSLAVGTHSITAAYDGGNTNYTKSMSTVLTQTVTQAKPSFTVTAPASITQGTASVVLTGTIAAGTSYPTGTVNVSINGQTGQGNIGASGAFTATVNIGTLTASGTPYPITYSYAGSTNFSSATNNSTGLTVTPAGPAATTTTMTSSVQQCLPGVPFTLFITVKSVAGTPSGQVVLSRKNPDGTSAAPLPQFLDSGGQWNPALNGTSDALQVGVTTYTATYQGVSNFQASSNQLQITCSAQ